jgi:Cysteine-rich CWC
MTLPDPAALATVCAACGAVFQCGAERESCWCAALPALAVIEPGRACLCPTCLAEEIRKSGSFPAA